MLCISCYVGTVQGEPVVSNLWLSNVANYNNQHALTAVDFFTTLTLDPVFSKAYRHM